MMGEVVSLWRLTDDKGENDLTGDSPKLGSDFRGDAVFCGDKICSAYTIIKGKISKIENFL